MFGWFRKAVVHPLSSRSASAIKTDVRALIQIANVIESGASGQVRANAGDAGNDALLRTTTVAEGQLAGSIWVAVPKDVSITIIVRDVIDPVLREAVVVSDNARDAVLRAVRNSGRG